MNIIIVGAGSVGFTAAQALSKVHDVLIVEESPSRAEFAKTLLYVSVLCDNGPNPRVLESAIRRHKAEAVIASTSRDDSNLFVCLMAKRVSPKIKTVSRISDPDFIVKTSSEGVEGIDQLISPEMITATKISKLALLENAVDYESLVNMDMVLTTFKVSKEHTKIVGQVVINLEIPPESTVVAVYRGEDVILANETTELHVDDRICVLGSPKAIEDFNDMMGVTDDANEFVILGGGVVGAHTARLLEGKKRYVKLIEEDEAVCRQLSKTFSNVIVVNANTVDPHILRSENVGRADALICGTDVDEKNLLACMVAMNLGTKKVISRYSVREYEDIFQYTGIESIIGYHRVVANEITKTLISDDQAIMRMNHEGELFFSVTLTSQSKICNEHLGDVRLPEGVRIAAVVRDGRIIYPRMDTVFRNGDKVLLFTYMTKVSKLERLFGTNALSEM
jgi:trk system potassium uptake protein TrkA